MSILKVNDIRRATTGSSTLVFNDPVTITSGTISASVLIGSLPGAVTIGDGTIGKEKLTNDARDWVNILNKPTGLLSSSAQIPGAISGSAINPSIVTSSIAIITKGYFSGSGDYLYNIPNSALTNNTITINGVATALGTSRTLVTADISESSNLYYTDARVKSKINAEGVFSSSGQVNYQAVQGQFSVNTLGSDGNSSFTVSAGIFITGSTGIDITTDSANAKITFKTKGGTVSSSAQTIAGLPIGTVSSSAQYPGWITSSTQVVQSLPTDTVSSSIQIKTFLPSGTVSASAQYPGWITSSTQVVQSLPGGTVSSSAQHPGWVTASSQIVVQNTTGIDAIATTGSNTFIGNQTISGSTTITGNLTVQGTSSVLYVTSSQLDVGSNKLTLNTTAVLRYGGLNVYDSGSLTNQSGSLLWDSVNNVWLFVHSGTSNTSSILITGPENTGALGNEQFLTQNLLPKAGLSGDHIVNSQISDNGTQVGIVGGLKVTGSITSSHIVPAVTDIYDLGSPSLKFRSLYLSGSTLYLGTLALSDVNGALAISPSGSPAGTNSPVSGAFTGSFRGNGSQLTNIANAALPDGIISSSTQLPAGTVSSSTQVTNNLPAGTVSSSTQITATSTTGFTSGVEQLLKDNNVHSGSFLGTATTNNLSEGFTNLYYTDARVKTKLNVEAVHSGSSLGTATTTNLAEGTNLYFTNVRVLTALPVNTVSSSNQVTTFLPAGTVSSSTQVNLSQAFSTASHALTASYAMVTVGTTATNTDGLPEGSTNLYYADSRVKTKLDTEGVHSGSSLGTATTTNLTEGINLYFTNTRAVNALPIGTVSSSTQIKNGLPSGTVSSSVQVIPFPFTGSALISGSLRISNPLDYDSTATFANFSNITASIGANATRGQVGTISNTGLQILVGNTPYWEFNTAGGLVPTYNIQDIGSNGTRIRTLWVTNVSSSNPILSASYALTASFATNATIPAGTVSSSAQIDYNSVTNKLSGIYSSSTQVVSALNGQTITATLSGNASTANSAGTVTGTTGQILYRDDRIIEPNAITAGYLQFGFTSWDNNNSTPYADYLHMRSYTDSSGGNDNLVMFRKDAIGMRIYQHTFGTGSAYSTYKDVAFTDSNITGTSTNITAYTINQSVGTGNSPSFAGLTVDTNTLYVDSSANSVGIGTTSNLDSAKLDVRDGKIVAGTVSATGGPVIIQGQYTNGALTVFGSEYSNGGPVLGYAVKPSTTAAGAFLSATGITVSRGAYNISGVTHTWYGGSSQTVAIDSAVSMQSVMSVDTNVLRVNQDQARIHISSSVGTNTSYTYITNAGGTLYMGKENSAGSAFSTTPYASFINAADTYPLVFMVNATERVRITNGNVFSTTGAVSASGAISGSKFKVGGGDDASISNGVIGAFNPSGLSRVQMFSNSSVGRLDFFTTENLDFAITHGGVGRIRLKNAGGNDITGDTNITGSLQVVSPDLSRNVLFVTGSGFVGINTTTPTSRLHVSGSGITLEHSNNAAISVAALANITYMGVISTAGYIGTSAGDLQIRAGATVKMFINQTTGNVGVGTTTPNAKLEVDGVVSGSGNYRLVVPVGTNLYAT